MLEKLSDALLTHFALVALGISLSHTESKTQINVTPMSHFYTHSFSGVTFLHQCHVFTYTHSLCCHVFTPVSSFYRGFVFPSFSTLKMNDTLLINTTVHTNRFQFIREKHNPRIVSVLCYTFQSFLGFKLTETLLIQHLTPAIKLQFIGHV